MDSRIVDLHVHSTESDGTFTPEELVLLAKEAGLSAFALTDHDTVFGVSKAAAKANACGIELIPGIELSTQYQFTTPKTGGKEVHIVGLYIDPQNQKLRKKTEEFRECRNLRNAKIVEALQREGFDITMEALAAENPDSVITRANIARFLYGHGLIPSIQDAFERYIGDGCRCFAGRFKVTPMEAVSLIHEAGGVAILAHPLLYHLSTANLNRLIDESKAAGLDGIEAVYSSHTAGEERFVRQLAKQHGLIISGGSDFHGANKPAIRLGTGRGSLCIPYTVLEDIRAIHGRYRVIK